LQKTHESASDNTRMQYQYVWSLRYIDAPILRDENKDADGDSTDGSDERIHYLTDANMNVVALVDKNAAVLERYAYDPYGNVTIYNADWSSMRTSSSYDNPVLYCGYWRDCESGLYHVRYRYYHDRLGRWITRDPLGYIDGMSVYGYVEGNPLTHTDPSGLCTNVESLNADIEAQYRLIESIMEEERQRQCDPAGRGGGSLGCDDINNRLIAAQSRLNYLINKRNELERAVRADYEWKWKRYNEARKNNEDCCDYEDKYEQCLHDARRAWKARSNMFSWGTNLATVTCSGATSLIASVEGSLLSAAIGMMDEQACENMRSWCAGAGPPTPMAPYARHWP